MNNARILLFVAVLVVLGIGMTVYTVDERQYAIKFRFGEIIDSDIAPGLHFKIPVVNNVQYYPNRVLTILNPQEEFLTFEKKNLIVDFFVKWRINDVADYYRATGGEEVLARQRLLEIVKDGIRAEFAKRTVPEVVSAERRVIMDQMLAKARADAERFGIDVVDVRVKRIEFRDDVADSVYNRMRQERARVAAELRAQGAEAAEQIRAEADRERTVVLAEAYRDAEKIRGEGDAQSAEIYAQAYGKNPEFYAFYRTTQAYRRSLGQAGDLLVLDAEGEFLRYLNESRPKR